ncbi:3605_t:CDS:1 [Dentiscutata heterogama]|uniref:3605_t:CDS:1 n=1 Tax=Dentiscutata heterogama TaxID=1316150 RepID=A0ACA9QEY6_9GLOM|nr:3605_t:CDS:1 [Dentiscutata heterogama]
MILVSDIAFARTMAPHKPFSCLLCNNSYSFKSSLSSQETVKHKMNRIVQHHQYFSVLPKEIINHFRAVFLQDINNKLGFHRSNEGVNTFNRIVQKVYSIIFSNEIEFSYRPSIRRYTCIFNGQNGYNRIGNMSFEEEDK